MATMTGSRWSTDVTLFCELLAERLAAEGAEHPLDASVAIAVRGRHGGDQAILEQRLGEQLGPRLLIEICYFICSCLRTQRGSQRLIRP